MSEHIIKNPEALRGLADRMVSMVHVATSSLGATQRITEVLTVIAQTEHDHTTKIEQQRDAALARVKELELRDEQYEQIRKIHTNVIHSKDKLIDELSSDVQCAKLASELASKEREALRQLVRDYQELSARVEENIRALGGIHMDVDWDDERRISGQEANALLGTEEPK